VAVVIDRDEWLEWRRAGIGASDVAGILGISPWSSPYSVWADKVGLTEHSDPTEAMEMGLALEPTIAHLFHTRTGLYLLGAQTRCEHPELPWARATLDGYCGESESTPFDLALGNVESKTTADGPARWEEAIPDHYAAQVQWQMFVTGAERTWVAVIHAAFGLAFRVYEVERDDNDIAFIVDAVTAFWNDHVETGIPPEADGSAATTDALHSLPVDPDAVVELDDVADLLNQRRSLKADEKATEEALAAVDNRIRAAMGEATEGYIDGELAVSWRPQERRSLDAKALKADHPGFAAEYEKITTSRVLRVHSKKER
jgi:putative phage-type endonuclease